MYARKLTLHCTCLAGFTSPHHATFRPMHPQDTREGKTGVVLPPVTRVIAPAPPKGAGIPAGPLRKRPRLGGLGPAGRPPRPAPDRPVIGLVRPLAVAEPAAAAGGLRATAGGTGATAGEPSAAAMALDVAVGGPSAAAAAAGAPTGESDAAASAPDTAAWGPGAARGVPQAGEVVEVRAREAGYLGGWLRGRVLQVGYLGADHVGSATSWLHALRHLQEQQHGRVLTETPVSCTAFLVAVTWAVSCGCSTLTAWSTAALPEIVPHHATLRLSGPIAYVRLGGSVPFTLRGARAGRPREPVRGRLAVPGGAGSGVRRSCASRSLAPRGGQTQPQPFR